MKTILQFIVIITLFSACRVMVVERPADPVIVIPASPGSGYIYINDSWRWNRKARAYSASKGYWVEPKKSAVWVDGHWSETRGGWKYVKGHWR